MSNEHETRFPKLSAPARCALAGAGYAHLDEVAQVSESDLKKPHGMGPRPGLRARDLGSALEALRAALDERGLSFRD